MLGGRLQSRKQIDSGRGKGGRLLSRSIVTISVLLLFVVSAVAVVPTFATTNAYTPTTLSIGGADLIAPQATDWISGAGSLQGFTAYTGGAVQVNYQAVGSTTGTQDMLADIFSIGFSDTPLPANGLGTLGTCVTASLGDDCVTSPANSPPGSLAGNDPVVQIPDGLAAIAIFYYIPGISSISLHLNLTGSIVEQIYLKQITSWGNYHILALNPALTAGQIATLKSTPIFPVHRSDGSGSSFILTTYFGRTGDNNWTADGYTAGSTSASNFPSGELGGKGSAGVAATVAGQAGAIGYAEVSYVSSESNLAYAKIENSASNFVSPLPAGAAAAAAADSSLVLANPTYIIVQAPGAWSYPLSTYTYAFIWQNQDVGGSLGGVTWSAGLAYDSVQFLYFAVTQGQEFAEPLLYAPLPSAVVQIALNLIASINYNGVPILPTTTNTLTCNRSSATVGTQAITCTDAVGGASPTGTVAWFSLSAGAFTRAICTLSRAGKCSSTFHTTAAASSSGIVAMYYGDVNNAPSLATSALSVGKATSHTTLSCSPSHIAVSATVTCIATVSGYSPTGTVTFSQSVTNGVTFTSTTCTLTAVSAHTSRCSVTATGTTAGADKVTASYGGDSNNAVSTSTQKAVNVT